MGQDLPKRDPVRVDVDLGRVRVSAKNLGCSPGRGPARGEVRLGVGLADEPREAKVCGGGRVVVARKSVRARGEPSNAATCRSRPG